MIKSEKREKTKPFPSKKAKHYSEQAVLLQSCENVELCMFLIEKCRTCPTTLTDRLTFPMSLVLTPPFPPPLNPHPRLQPVLTPDLTFLVWSTTERVAVLFITLKNATWSPRVVCDGHVSGNNSLFHQPLGMSVNEKICALEVTAQNSLFSNWHAKILIV